MDISTVIETKTNELQEKLKLIFGREIKCNLKAPKISSEEVTKFKDLFGLELVAMPSLDDLPLEEEYFDKMYPHKNKFWKDEYKASILNDHLKYGGKFILYESLQKPNFVSEVQLYGSLGGEQQGLDKIEKEFLESYEFLEAKDDLALTLASNKTRYAWSYNNIENYVLAQLGKEIKKAGLPGEAIIRPGTNFYDTVYFPYNGKSETYEWTSTKLIGNANRLTVGHAPLGGLSCILDHDPATYYANIGARFAILL